MCTNFWWNGAPTFAIVDGIPTFKDWYTRESLIPEYTKYTPNKKLLNMVNINQAKFKRVQIDSPDKIESNNIQKEIVIVITTKAILCFLIHLLSNVPWDKSDQNMATNNTEEKEIASETPCKVKGTISLYIVLKYQGSTATAIRNIDAKIWQNKQTWKNRYF